MSNVRIVCRELTSKESNRMDAGFDELSIEEGVELERSERFSFVTENEDGLIGCSSGLAFKNGDNYSGWFHLTDLFIEKEHRSKGLGAELLEATEAKMASLGIKHIFLWTSDIKAINFYERNGYKKFAALEHWYSDGTSRVGLRKNVLMPIAKVN